MRQIQITAAQARLIQQADAASRDAKQRLELVLAATLGGHGVEGAEVLHMNTDGEAPVLMIREAGEQNGPALNTEALKELAAAEAES